MANGYLGKISAVVAANTGDYVRKLNDSASTTKAFAKAISSDLSRASRDATKSIESILTPIQRVERALQNAASQKLAFRGFDGAIQTVEQLRKVIEKIADRPVELQFLLKQSGLKTLEQIRQTIGSISEKNLQLALRVGGVDGLRRLREDVQEINGKLVNVTVKTDAAELDRLIEVFEQIDPGRVRQLQVDVEARQLEQAVLLNKQLVSVASEVTDAYGRAKQQFAGFAAEVQVALGPGLRASDSGILKLLDDIQNEIPIAEAEFNRLSQAAQAAVQAINRVGEADAKVRSLSSGQELAFSRRGDISRELSRAEASQQSVAGLGNAADLFARQKAAAAAVVVELGKMEAAELQLGGGARVTTKEYERQLAILRNITAEIERSAAAQGNADSVAAVITGNPQNFDQGRALQSQLERQIAGLNRSQRQDFKWLLTQANDLSVGNDPANLEKYLDVLQKVQFEVAKKLRVNIETDRAEADAKRLRSSLEALRQNADFVITGRPQNIAQVQAELNKVLGTLDQLDEEGRQALRPSIERVNIAVNGEQLDDANEALDELRANASQAITVTVTTGQAMSRIDAINEAWDKAIRQIPNSAEAIDAEFNSILGDISNLGLADRLNLDPLIAAFRNSVAAGEPLIAQFQRLLELRQQVNGLGDIPVSDQPQSLGQSTNLAGGRARERMRAASQLLGIDRQSPVAVPRDLSQLGSQINSLRGQIETLPVALRGGLSRELTVVQDRFVRLSASIRPSVAEVQRLEQAVSRVAANSKRVNLANAFQTNFGGAGTQGVLANLNENSLKGYSAQLELLQKTIGRASAEARGPAVQAFARLRDAIADAMNRGELETAQAQSRIELFRQSAIKATAAAAGIGAGGLERRLSRVGDVARGSFSNVGLAVQQAVFAFEDFFSVTGGLDQRIRAAGNNISQLGFILGGGLGLGIGVAVGLVGQLAAGFVRWYTEADKAEAATKRLNSALDGQRSKTEELAKSYKELAESISRAALPERERERAARRDPILNVERTQEARRRDIAAANLPTVGAAGARIDAIDKQLENEANILARRRLVSERLRLSARVDGQVNDVLGRASGIADTATRFQGANAIRVLIEGAGGLRQVQGDLGRAERLGDTAGVARLTSELAALTVAIQLLRDREVAAGFDRQQTIAESLTRTAANVQESGGNRFVDDTQALISAAIQRANDRFSDGSFTAFQRDRELGRAERMSISLEEASIQAGRFADALTSATQQIANAAEQDLARRSESLRRDANASEARFGEQDVRTQILRSQQSGIEAARAVAGSERRAIEREIANRSINFAREADAGRGNQQAAGIAARIRQLEALANARVDPRLAGQSRQEFIDRQQAAAQEAIGLREQLRGIFDALPETQALRQRADQIDVEAQRRLQAIESSARGRELTLTQPEREAEAFAQSVADIRQYAADAAEVSAGLPNEVGRINRQANDAIDRLLLDQARQVAPVVFGFQDERINAALQGPSRAALNVADANTVEGARELSRLLRGEDPSKDVNLAELQRQTTLLEGLLQAARMQGLDPVVEIRG